MRVRWGILTFLTAVGVASWALLALSCPRALAAEAGNVGIMPAGGRGEPFEGRAWFVYDLAPGQSVQDAAVITNTSTKPLKVRVYAVDATVTREGAFALLGEDWKNRDVGGWVRLPVGGDEVLTLSPGEKRRLPFTFAVPPNADTGDHLGGIVVQEVEPFRGQGIQVITRVGVRIYETVPGRMVRRLTFDAFRARAGKDRVDFHLQLSNQGNVRIEPSGEIVVKSLFGRPVGKVPFVSAGIVLRGQQVDLPVVWDTPPPLGIFRAEASVGYPGGPRLTRETRFTIIPRNLVLGGLAVLFAILALAAWVLSRYEIRPKRRT